MKLSFLIALVIPVSLIFSLFVWSARVDNFNKLCGTHITLIDYALNYRNLVCTPINN